MVMGRHSNSGRPMALKDQVYGTRYQNIHGQGACQREPARSRSLGTQA